jgi:hypothetical protein
MKNGDKSDLANKFCRKCVRTCKQTDQILMLDCPRFQPRPFKMEEHRFQQLDLFNKKKK